MYDNISTASEASLFFDAEESFDFFQELQSNEEENEEENDVVDLGRTGRFKI